MTTKARPYIFYGQTQSLCEECLAVVPAKIIFQHGNVYYQKRCVEHGVQKTLVSTDIEYFKRCKDYLKPRLSAVARTIAVYALITSSILAWRCLKSLTNAICIVRCASPIPRRAKAIRVAWKTLKSCCKPYWTASSSPI